MRLYITQKALQLPVFFFYSSFSSLFLDGLTKAVCSGNKVFWDHRFKSTYTNFFEKLTFLTHYNATVLVRI